MKVPIELGGLMSFGLTLKRPETSPEDEAEPDPTDLRSILIFSNFGSASTALEGRSKCDSIETKSQGKGVTAP